MKKTLVTCLALGLALFSTIGMAFSRDWENLNADPFVGNFGHLPESKTEALSQAPLAVVLLDFPAPVQAELLEAIRNGCGRMYFIRNGEYVPVMLAGKGERMIDLTVKWKNREAPLPATWYQVEWDGRTYVLVCPLLCYNWNRGDQDGRVLMRLPDVSVGSG